MPVLTGLVDPRQVAAARSGGQSEIRRIMASRGVEVPTANAEADARVTELERIATLPEPQLPEKVSTSDLDKAISKLARERIQSAAQRTIAAELLPAARVAAEDYVSADAVDAVVDALVEDFDRQVSIARTAANMAPDVEPSQLAGLSAEQFGAWNGLNVAVGLLEAIVEDRRTVAHLRGEPQTASVDLRRWGAIPVLVAVLSPPPWDTPKLIDGYQQLYAELSALSGLDPVARWRDLFRMEATGTLRLRLAPLGEAPTRVAIALSWWDPRWAAQSRSGDGLKDALNRGSSMWRTIETY